MEQYLPMVRQAVASRSPCRALQILLHKEELFLGKLILLLQLDAVKIFWGYKLYRSVTSMRLETTLPSFDTVLLNCCSIFERCRAAGSVGIAKGLGVQPPVHVYRLSFLSKNLFVISILGQNFKHFDI